MPIYFVRHWADCAIGPVADKMTPSKITKAKVHAYQSYLHKSLIIQR